MAEIVQVFVELFSSINSSVLIVAGTVVGGSLVISAAIFTVAVVLLAKLK
jgi:hypothetical protein